MPYVVKALSQRVAEGLTFRDSRGQHSAFSHQLFVYADGSSCIGSIEVQVDD
jgi:hypothetical protein